MWSILYTPDCGEGNDKGRRRRTDYQHGIAGRSCGTSGACAYSVSKSGLLAVTRDLALEWGQYGITCNAVSPTVVMTPMARDYWTGERGAAHLAQIPAGRFAEMDEIARNTFPQTHYYPEETAVWQKQYA